MKAFPLNSKEPENHGMDLRDYFAAKALQGYLACKGWHPNFDMAFNQDYAEKGKTAIILSKICYQMADAMLNERNKNDS